MMKGTSDNQSSPSKELEQKEKEDASYWQARKLYCSYCGSFDGSCRMYGSCACSSCNRRDCGHNSKDTNNPLTEENKSLKEQLTTTQQALAVQQFTDRLEKKLNDAVIETYKELQKELPNNIKVKIHEAILPLENERKIAIEVDLRASINGKEGA